MLEIGPGTGQLTRRLLARGVQVVAVEIDRDLCRLLRKRFANEPRFQLLEGDFLRLPLPPQPRLLVANIPYNLTGPILEKVLGSPAQPVRQFERIILMVQKELAERLQAGPGSKAYGALSVRVRYLAECELICRVPPSAFQPPPQVESAVVRLTPAPPPLPPAIPAGSPSWFAGASPAAASSWSMLCRAWWIARLLLRPWPSSTSAPRPAPKNWICRIGWP